MDIDKNIEAQRYRFIKSDHLIIQPNSIALVWFHLSWIGWSIAAILFIIEPSLSAIPLVVVLSLLCGFFLTLKSPLLGLYLLPLPMMMGPVFSFNLYGIGFITAGDFYSMILISRSLFLHDVNGGKPGGLILLLGFFLLLLSSALSYDLLASLVGLARIMQYVLLVRVSMLLIRKPAEAKALFNSWVFITTLCSIIMICHQYSGRTNMIYWVRSPGYDYSLDLERSDVFFRANFFYYNFFIPMGLSLIFSITQVIRRVESNKVLNGLILMTIPINIIALILNNTRSMLFPVAILCGLAVICSFANPSIRKKLGLRKVIMLVMVSIFSTTLLLGAFLTSSQRFALFERVMNEESIILRLGVWESALGKMIDNPFRLLIGWGPQATLRQSERPHMQRLLTGSIGNTEGAFDSTIIGFLVEFGLILSTLIFIYIFAWFLDMSRYYRVSGNPTLFSILMMATALIICYIFQQFSFTPPALITLQVFAIQPRLLWSG